MQRADTLYWYGNCMTKTQIKHTFFIVLLAAILVALAAWAGLFGSFMESRPSAIPVSWQQATDATSDVRFWYPADLGTTYIHTIDWPPVIANLAGPYSCTEAGSEIAQAGETKEQTVNGRKYCVTKESEGAAGSIYTRYVYATERDGRMLTATFSLRLVQCGNYEPDETEICTAERAAFYPGGTIDRILGSIVL